ncbi:MAG: hypothetical protein V1826_01855 [bacterium]
MPIKGYVLGIGISTVLTLAAWVLVLFYFEPQTTGGVGLALFFVSLGLWLIGALTLGLFAIASRWSTNLAQTLAAAARSGVLVGLAVVSLMLLKTFDGLSWWNSATIVLAALLLEIYFRVKVE